MTDYTWSWDNNYYEKTIKCTCPFCQNQIAGSVINAVKRKYILEPDYKAVFLILRCPSCDHPIIYAVSSKRTYPASSQFKDVQKLPKIIEHLYWEVRIATASGCYTAAIGLARTVIMHIAVEKGAAENLKFKVYVDYLCGAGYVPPNSTEWVDKIRLLGNDTVHSIEERTQEDAELITKFLMYLLIFIYELPQSI